MATRSCGIGWDIGAKPNAICIQIAQLAPCCYDDGTQLPEFIWK